ncbi:MAG TPA: hypothetical protein VLK65_13705 [Vicinamibacteria bacterium]|nr:hypothetical protein [Vicinamibacteria bacterium]
MPKARPAAHLGPEDFCELIEGRLSGGRLAEVEVHLDACAECVEALADVARMERPASPEEEAVLARLASQSPAERVEKLKPQLEASARESTGISFDWKSVLAAAAVALVLIAGGRYVYLSHWLPSESRRIAAETLERLVELRQATGRIPLRYIREFERASVTRSGFDVSDPSETALLENLRRAVERSAEPAAVQTLALLLLDEGELDESEKLLDTLLESDPQSAMALNALAVLHYQRAQLQPEGAYQLQQRGLALLRRAQASAPDDLLILYNFGLFYEALDMPQAAAQAWARYVERDSGSQWAEEAAFHFAQLQAR